MPTLHELQTDFVRTMLGPHSESFSECIHDDGMSVDARLDVYRNNVFTSLTDILVERFPVVCRVINERFFRYAADSFIRACPPCDAVLSVYGDKFADFLTTFPPCQALAYLPDLARLEWLIHAAAQAPETELAQRQVLTAFTDGDLQRLGVDLYPSLGVLQSNWPVDAIWRANRSGAGEGTTIDLNDGGVCLMVLRDRGEVGFRRLSASEFTFCSTLLARRALVETVEATLAIDPGFDASAAIVMLCSADAVVAWHIG